LNNLTSVELRDADVADVLHKFAVEDVVADREEEGTSKELKEDR
jgi:hypothetical protein